MNSAGKTGAQRATPARLDCVERQLDGLQAWRYAVDEQLARLAAQATNPGPGPTAVAMPLADAAPSPDDAITARLTRIEHELSRLPELLDARLDETADELREEFGEDLDSRAEEVHNAVIAEIDETIDDRVLGIKDECKDYIVEEVADCISQSRLRLEL
ncbi:hypothetical protein SLS56_012169 [Neofusicoccum ribis]|uniref:Uncharacterized protein n=1 Tax=Neofusicoccum ribis TaxID=45134 RepID=A0ABR3SAB1_9PEZI